MFYPRPISFRITVVPPAHPIVYFTPWRIEMFQCLGPKVILSFSKIFLLGFIFLKIDLSLVISSRKIYSSTNYYSLYTYVLGILSTNIKSSRIIKPTQRENRVIWYNLLNAILLHNCFLCWTSFELSHDLKQFADWHIAVKLLSWQHSWRQIVVTLLNILVNRNKKLVIFITTQFSLLFYQFTTTQNIPTSVFCLFF